MNNKNTDIVRFYRLLSDLQEHLGTCMSLEEANGEKNWPKHGIYFLLEPNEPTILDNQIRVTRVGTHDSQSNGTNSPLWERLKNHRGNMNNLQGNNITSVFRKDVGIALIMAGWKPAGEVSAEQLSTLWKKNKESWVKDLEIEVSKFIRSMRVLIVPADAVGVRFCIEANSIALLSNYSLNGPDRINSPSDKWLGNFSDNAKIKDSGLWNKTCVDSPYDNHFFDVFERCIDEAKAL